MRTEIALYARLLTFRRALAEARRIVARAFDTEPSWYVAFSGGKDSTCVLALVREKEPATPAVISQPEWILPETAAYLDRVENLHRTASGSDHATGWAPNWESPEDVPQQFTWLGEKGAVERNYGRPEQGVFLGLRQDESRTRRVHLRKLGPLFFNHTNGVWQCNPLSRWSVMDVWAYIWSVGLDYNRAYDRMEEIGVPLEQQRIGPLAVERALGYGQLAILKRGWPDLFNAYAERHPEARSYV